MSVMLAMGEPSVPVSPAPRSPDDEPGHPLGAPHQGAASGSDRRTGAHGPHLFLTPCSVPSRLVA